MGHRGRNFNDLGDVFAWQQAQIDGQAKQMADLTDFVWEHLPVEFPEVELAEGSAFLPLVVIAAVDAPEEWIQYASVSPYGFVCDGVDDEVQFIEAEDIFDVAFFGFSIIWLSPGTFNINAGFANGPAPGALRARYKGHNVGSTGVNFTTIDVTTGWGVMPEVDGFPGQLVPALQLVGDFEDIAFNFQPDDLPDGDLIYVASAVGKIHNLDFTFGSGSPPAGVPVACEYVLALSGTTTGSASACNATVNRNGIDPTEAIVDLSRVDDFTLEVLGNGDPYPKISLCRNICNDITLNISGEATFETGHFPIQIDGESILSNVRIFGDFDWTDIDGIVQLNPNLENDDSPVLVDVSTFLVDSPDHPRIFYRDALFDQTTNLGSRVLHGATDERPLPEMCIGTVYINTDDPGAPVLEWSDGTQWWVSAPMT